MKVTALMGSPRKKKNTSVLMDKWIEGFLSTGEHQVETFSLEQLNIRGCTGCDACQNGRIEYCIKDDPMKDIYKSILESEIIVVASPVYCFSMTAQTKAVIDRLYAVINKVKGKKVVCLTTFGDEDEQTAGAVNFYNILDMLCRYTSMDIIQKLGVSTGDIPVSKNEEALNQAYEWGNRAAKSF